MITSHVNEIIAGKMQWRAKDLEAQAESQNLRKEAMMTCREMIAQHGLDMKLVGADMSFGGDTPGQNSGSYKNIESTVGPEMGSIEVYKVHHHGSATSSWTDWLNATHPKVAVISEGNGNSYGHPTSSALGRLHWPPPTVGEAWPRRLEVSCPPEWHNPR